MSASHLDAAQVSSTSLSIQLPDNGLGKAVDDSPSAWAPAPVFQDLGGFRISKNSSDLENPVSESQILKILFLFLKHYI